MLSSLPGLNRIGVALAAVGVAVVISSGRPPAAQSEQPSVQLRMTAEEIQNLIDGASRRLSYVPHQVVVKFKEGVGRAGQQRALLALRSRPAVDDLQWMGPVAIVTDPGQPDATILAQQLRGQPEVQYAEPNYLRRLTSTPNDPAFLPRQWNLQTLDMPKAWDVNAGANNNIIVAVVDSGVTTTDGVFPFKTWNGFAIVDAPTAFAVNPDLSSSRLVSPQDFVFNSGSTVLDMVGHGTHVSSTIGEDTNNAKAEAGIAYNVKIMPVKVCLGYWDIQFAISDLGITGFNPIDGFCPSAETAQGIRYAADNGARVINLSLGGDLPSIAEQDAIKYAVSKGVFVAIAAGNEYEEGNPIEYPAAFAKDIDGAMAVAAVGRSLKHAYYSNTGSYIEIAAPGGDLRESFPDGGIWQPMIYLPDSDPEAVLFPRFDRYAETPMQGTSMATPHVAGIAALIMSQLGDGATPAAVEQIIKKTARACDSSDCDPATPVVGTAGRNDTFGAGLIQPLAALYGRGLRK